MLYLSIFVSSLVFAGSMSGTFGSSNKSTKHYKSSTVFGTSVASSSDKKSLNTVFRDKKVTAMDKTVQQNFSKHKGQHTYSAKVEHFIFPTDKKIITSYYGFRTATRFHDGIDIAGKKGANIYAVAPGVVIYSDDRISGYGNMVVIKHPSGYSTVYAHNSVNKVKKGDKVRQGQVIALMGRSGHATGVHLHFEVRDRDGYSKNPMDFLK